MEKFQDVRYKRKRSIIRARRPLVGALKVSPIVELVPPNAWKRVAQSRRSKIPLVLNLSAFTR